METPMRARLIILFLLLLSSLCTMGQTPVTRNCKTCGVAISQCPYKGKHPAPKAETTVSKPICKTCGRTLARCLYKGRHPVSQASYEDGVLTVNDVTYKMVYVPGGTFAMGATVEQENYAVNDERPVHNVTLSNYMIGQTEVTQGLWQAVMGSNPSFFIGDDCPVENVTWNDCQTFIQKLNSLTGQHFRLPTEAEWEYAARGGRRSIGYIYSGNNDIHSIAWYTDNSSGRTHPVALKQPNELGIYDMSGNVWEWCQDWYGSYSSSSQTNPAGVSTGNFKVYRGGGWRRAASFCRSARRNGNAPSRSNDDIGLRLAL